MWRNVIALMLLISTLAGCSSMTGIGQTIKGGYYLRTGNYRQAQNDLQQAVAQNPESGLAQYYLGRSLLGQKKSAEALTPLQRAVTLEPSEADYVFWLGVAFGETGDEKGELASYEHALQLNPKHDQARLYLGHLQLKQGLLTQALRSYDMVLGDMPDNAAALYNRALILDLQGDGSAAKNGWLAYLKKYPAGDFARMAADHLNALGNFSYENQYLGHRTVTLAEIGFQPHESKVKASAFPSLKLVGAIVSNLAKGRLQIVVYVKNNQSLARQRAAELEKVLHELAPTIAPDRMQVSWFDVSEKVKTKKKEYEKNESVRFFLTDWK